MPRTKNKQKKLHVKKGDMVALTKAITAAKELNADRPKGHTAKVLEVFPQRDRVLVEGVNLRLKHTRPTELYPQGGRIEREMPIHISNVMPVDSDGNPTRIGRKKVEEALSGKARWVRYAKTNDQELDI